MAAALRIRTPTAILMPRNALETTGMLRKSFKNRERAKMITKEGSTIPKVAAVAPKSPACLKPTKVAQLMAMGPGVDSAMAVTVTISSWVIQLFFSTQISSISAIMAYPPPKVNKPILKKVPARSGSFL